MDAVVSVDARERLHRTNRSSLGGHAGRSRIRPPDAESALEGTACRDALERLGLTPRETEVLRAAAATPDEAEIACELFLSLRAVRERLERLEAKLGVRTAAEAVARARRESA